MMMSRLSGMQTGRKDMREDEYRLGLYKEKGERNTAKKMSNRC